MRVRDDDEGRRKVREGEGEGEDEECEVRVRMSLSKQSLLTSNLSLFQSVINVSLNVTNRICTVFGPQRPFKNPNDSMTAFGDGFSFRG